MTEKSGLEKGAENLATMERYLTALRQEGQGLPARNGKLSISVVALATGLDRQVLYKNPGVKALLEQAAQELGLQGITAREATGSPEDLRDRRIQQLETQNASLRAEVEGLRKQLRRYEHLQAHLIESGGRRVIP